MDNMAHILERENMSDQELVKAEEVADAEEPAIVEEESPQDDSPESEPEAQIDQPESSSETVPVEESSTLDADTKENGASETLSILTLKRGQSMSGTVKNIAQFGAFVDIGLPQDGLVHISELARKKVEKVEDVVSVGQEVDVWVKKVDKKRGRISLTMIKPISVRLRDIEEDAELEGTVTRLEPYGAFVEIGSERDGLVHISQVTHDYIKHPEDALSVGDTVRVKVLKVNRKKRQVDLSIKALLPPPEPEVKEAPKVQKVEEVQEDVAEDEAVPTAMALAYEAMQNKSRPDESATSKELSEEKDKRKQEMDDIVTRTLATSE